MDSGGPTSRLFKFTIGPHSDQYETQIIAIQKKWIIKFDSAGLKSVSCARLFAALIKIEFVLFKIKLLYLRTENLKFQVESFENQQKIFRIGYKFDQRARTNSLEGYDFG